MTAHREFAGQVAVVTGAVLAVDGGYRAHGATELRGTPNQQATEQETKA